MINVNLTTAENESIQHSTVKKYLVNYLRNEASENDFCKVGPIGWRSNRPAPHCGIWEEYPFFYVKNWDYKMALDKILFNGEEMPDTDEKLWKESSKYMEANQVKLDFVADIAIQHKGMIEYVVEIVAYNPPSKEKIGFYKENNIRCYNANAFGLYDKLIRNGKLTEKDFMKFIK